MEACLKASNEVYAEISANNADYKKVYDSMVAFRADEYLWWQVAEYGFDTFMMRNRSASEAPAGFRAHAGAGPWRRPLCWL